MLGAAFAALFALTNISSAVTAEENFDPVDSTLTNSDNPEINHKKDLEPIMNQLIEANKLKYTIYQWENGKFKLLEQKTVSESDKQKIVLAHRTYADGSQYLELSLPLNMPDNNSSLVEYEKIGSERGWLINQFSAAFIIPLEYSNAEETGKWVVKDSEDTSVYECDRYVGPRQVTMPKLNLQFKSKSSNKTYTTVFNNVSVPIEDDMSDYVLVSGEGADAHISIVRGGVSDKNIIDYLQTETGSKSITLLEYPQKLPTEPDQSPSGESTTESTAGDKLYGLGNNKIYGYFTLNKDGEFSLGPSDDPRDPSILFSEGQTGDTNSGRPSKPSNNTSKPGKPDQPAGDSTPVESYRLYNPNTGEHFYTNNKAEHDMLVKAGWNTETRTWKLPTKSDYPIYRLYNPNSGDHHYTLNSGEKDALVGYGWKDEGVAMYSAGNDGQVIYRLYNPNEKVGQHFYTASKAEKDVLVKAGWNDEGTGFYGLK